MAYHKRPESPFLVSNAIVFLRDLWDTFKS